MAEHHVSVHPIDLGYMKQPEAAGAFLVNKGTTNCLVESGPSVCLPSLIAGLEKMNIGLKQIDGLILTHIHLDHAGASGHITREKCHAHVHPRGARHLIDPERLNASAYRVFGEELDLELGTMEPNQSERVHEVRDGESVEIGELTFRALETLGHARHHHAWLVQDDSGSHLFCGDAAGMRIPGTNFPTLPMVPPEFDADEWLKSIEAIETTQADNLWLTHYGQTTIASGFLRASRDELIQEVEFLTKMIKTSKTHLPEKHRSWHQDRAQAYDVSPELLSTYCRPGFYKANYDGVSRWLAQ
jgi:glyoxylase-like metal-dependent hydrolase (beta-lactamase superfamily II)